MSCILSNDRLAGRCWELKSTYLKGDKVEKHCAREKLLRRRHGITYFLIKR